jgi:hypothetical protein
MCVFGIFCAGQKEHFSHVFKYLKYHARHRTKKKVKIGDTETMLALRKLITRFQRLILPS